MSLSPKISKSRIVIVLLVFSHYHSSPARRSRRATQIRNGICLWDINGCIPAATYRAVRHFNNPGFYKVPDMSPALAAPSPIISIRIGAWSLTWSQLGSGNYEATGSVGPRSSGVPIVQIIFAHTRKPESSFCQWTQCGERNWSRYGRRHGSAHQEVARVPLFEADYVWGSITTAITSPPCRTIACGMPRLTGSACALVSYSLGEARLQ